MAKYFKNLFNQTQIIKGNKRKNQLTPTVRMLNNLMLILLMLSMVTPFLNVLSIALSDKQGSMSPGINLLPKNFSFEGFQYIWQRIKLWQPLLNSMFVAVVGSGLQTFLSAITGIG